MHIRTLSASVAGLGAAALISSCGSSAPVTTPATSFPASPAVAGPPTSHVTTVGQPFTVAAYLGSNEQVGGTFSITVESVTCGPLPTPTETGSLENGVPTPGAGQEFCTVALSGTNTTSAPAYWQPEDLMLYAGSVSYADDESDSAVFSYSEAFPYLGTVMNPGTTSTDVDVFELPAGSQPTSAWVPDGSTVGGQQSGVVVTVAS